MSTNKTEAAHVKKTLQLDIIEKEGIMVRNPSEEHTAESIRIGYWTTQALLLTSACILQLVAGSDLSDDHPGHFVKNLIIYLILAGTGNWLLVEVRRDPGFLTTPRFDPNLLEEEKRRRSQNQTRQSMQERKFSKSDPTVVDLMVIKYYEENLQDCEMVRYPTSHRERHNLHERLIQPDPEQYHYSHRRPKNLQPIELTLLSHPKKSFVSPLPPLHLTEPARAPHTKPHLAPFHLTQDISSPPRLGQMSASEPETPHFLLQTRVISFGGGPDMPLPTSETGQPIHTATVTDAKQGKPPSSGSSSKGSSLRCKSRNLERFITREFKSKEKKPRKTVAGDREFGKSLHASSGHFTFNSSGSGAFQETEKSGKSRLLDIPSGKKMEIRGRLNSVELQSPNKTAKGSLFSDRRKLSAAHNFMNDSKMSDNVGPTISEEDSLSDDRQNPRDVANRLETEPDEGDASSSSHEDQKESDLHSEHSVDSEQTQRGDHDDVEYQKPRLSSEQEIQRFGRADLPTSIEESSARNTFLRANADLAESPPNITIPCLVAIRSSPVQHDCKICHIQQPFRTRHCRACGACVAKFDHHCYYLGSLSANFRVLYWREEPPHILDHVTLHAGAALFRLQAHLEQLRQRVRD